MSRWLLALSLLLLPAASVSALPSGDTSSHHEDAKKLFDEGKRAQEQKRFQDAIDAYEQSLKADDGQAEAYSNLGFCYKSLKRYERAITNYKHALRINPDLAEAHEYLGEAYVELGKLDKARKEYETLVKLGSDEAEELKEKIDAADAAAHAR